MRCCGYSNGDELLPLHHDRLARDTIDLLTVCKCVIECGAILRIHDLAARFEGTDIMAEVMLTLFGMMEKQFIKSRQKRAGEAAMARVIYTRVGPPRSARTMFASFGLNGWARLRSPSVLISGR